MRECGKCCGSCGSCANTIELSEGEIAMLQKLGQIPFLPVARTAADEKPIYLEDNDYTQEVYTLILQSLQNRGLITIDYDAPLKRLQNPAYDTYPICGSFALTHRGQQVLELLDIQGIT